MDKIDNRFEMQNCFPGKRMIIAIGKMIYGKGKPCRNEGKINREIRLYLTKLTHAGV